MTRWVRALGVVAAAVALSVTTAESLRPPAAAASVSAVARPTATSGSPTTAPAQPDCTTPTPRPARHRPRPRPARHRPTPRPARYRPTQPVPTTPGVTARVAAAAAARPSPVASATPTAVTAAVPLPTTPAPPASMPAIAEAPSQGLVVPAVAPNPQPVSAAVTLACLVVLTALLLLIFGDRLVGSQRRPPRL